MNDLKQQIFQCLCKPCAAIRTLVENGAVLQFSPVRAGRLCELAVVAAAGTEGMRAVKVVQARRDYARHLRVELRGPVSDADQPIHIQHAVTDSNHNPNARNRINLGEMWASLVGGVYYLGKN